jgi:hypothetical protein
MNVWHANTTEESPSAVACRLFDDERSLSYRDVVALWRDDDHFRRFFSDLLAAAPFEAFFWETPPITTDTFDRDFEFVLVDAPVLAGVSEEPRPFAGQFRTCPNDVVTFDNLGGDATLVAPCPGDADHAHLAAFLRTASSDRISSLWQAVGQAISERISSSAIWVSTSGAGVYWLHIRLDSRPKYYVWAPFRD